MAKVEKSKVQMRRNMYLEELASGVHHTGVSRDSGKRVRNAVFVKAAEAAGYSRRMAVEHSDKIDRKIGKEKVWKSFQAGFILENPTKEAEKKGKKEGKVTVEAQREIFEGVPEFGNDAHLGMVRMISVVGEKGVRFVKLRPHFRSDFAAMVAAGFSEEQAKNPKRLLEKIGRLSGKEIMDALCFLGVDSMKIAEVIEDFLSRKEVVEEVRLDDQGNRVRILREQYQGAAVNAGLAHLKDFMRIAKEEGAENGDDGAEGIEVSESVVQKCAGFLRNPVGA